MRTIAYTIPLLLTFSSYAMQKAIPSIIVTSESDSIILPKEHALCSATLASLLKDKINDSEPTLILKNLGGKLSLIKPYLAAVHAKDAHAIETMLQKHAPSVLAHVINTTDYLKIPIINDHALTILATKLMREDMILEALSSKNGIYHYNFDITLNKKLAQKMIAIHPYIRNTALTLHFLESFCKPKEKLLKGHNKPINSLCFSPYPDTFISVSEDATYEWDTKTGSKQLITTSPWHSVCISPCGNYCAGIEDNYLTLLQLPKKNKAIPHYYENKSYWLTTGTRKNKVQFSPDATYVAAAYDNTIIVDDVKSEEKRYSIIFDAGVHTLLFSRDSNYVACAGQKNFFKIYCAKTGQLVHTITPDSALWVTDLALSENNNSVAAATKDTLFVYDIKTGLCSKKINTILPAINNLLFSKSNDLLCCVSENSLYVTNLTDDSNARVVEKFNFPIQSFCFNHSSSDSNTIISTDKISIKTGIFTDNKWSYKCIKYISPLQEKEYCLQQAMHLNADSTQLAIATSRNDILLIDLVDEELKEWFDNDIKPEQVALLSYILSTLSQTTPEPSLQRIPHIQLHPLLNSIKRIQNLKNNNGQENECTIA